MSSNFLTHVQTLLANFREQNQNYLAYINGRSPHGDEAVIRQKIVEPFLVALGYDLSTEVQPEERAGTGSADIYVQAIGPDPGNPQNTLTIPAAVWELKRSGIQDLTEHEDQLQAYVLVKQVRYGILTNGCEIRLYERVKEQIVLSFVVNLVAFAPDASPPDSAAMEALLGLYDILGRASFLDVERFRHEIVSPPYHPLQLSPQFPHNEDRLIDGLKREIQQLKRLVVLNFQAHQQQVALFRQEAEQRQTEIETARTAVLHSVTDLQEKLRLPQDADSLDQFLEQLPQRWMVSEEDTFLQEAFTAVSVAQHLQRADRVSFENRVRRYYRRVTDYYRWRAKQERKLSVSQTLVRDFDQWQAEIGIMVTNPVAEFCLQTVYIFVTRLLLIRICEDKGILKEKISDGGYKSYLEFSHGFYDYLGHANRQLLQIAYQDTSYIYGHFFSKSVFDWYNWEEETIIRLLALLNPYDFQAVSADLIGRIYEEYVDELERKRKGQFYTPAQVVGKVLDAAAYDGPQITNRRLLDPACGSGRFLVEAMRRLVAQWEAAYRQSGEPIDYQELINERLRHSLFGLDVNRFACFLAEVNLVVQVLDLFRQSEKKFTILRFHIYPTNSLLPELGNGHGRIYLADAANDSEGQERLMAELIKQRQKHPTNDLLDFRHGFDFIVGNPPYVRADHPAVADLRQRIANTNWYPSLYKKWDLYIPFADLALNLLAENGRHAFIVSDAFQTEEYARQIRERLLNKTTLTYLGFAPGVYFFEGAAVYTFIYGLQNGPPDAKHKVTRELLLATDLSRPENIRRLPALKQAKWGEQIFRPEFEGDDGLAFDELTRLGQLCYISYGLRPLSADDSPIKFGREDILARQRSDIHTKPFVEGKDIKSFTLARWQWLEWGTNRVPDLLYRQTFPELYTSPKIIVGETSGVYYDAEGKFLDDHSTRNIVPYHYLIEANALDQVAKIMARQITDEEMALEVRPLPTNFEYLSKTEKAAMLIQARAQQSPAYDLRYLAALLNCHWLRHYMLTFVKRGSRERFYPDDLKQWPIAPAPPATQAAIGDLVETIIDARADLRHWQQQGHIIDADTIQLNPRLLLEKWRIPTGDLLDAHSFVTTQISGSLTRNISREGDKIIFRRAPEAYLQSGHSAVQEYLYRYLTANLDSLYHVNADRLIRQIPIPRTPVAVADFMDRLAQEELRVTLRWLDAARSEAVIAEWAYDLYGVAEAARVKMGGRLYRLSDMPAAAKQVSLLARAGDSPLRWVAFPWQDGWVIRTQAQLPSTVMLWVSDGRSVTAEQWVVTV
jgi:type I restriction enzyme M protein